MMFRPNNRVWPLPALVHVHQYDDGERHSSGQTYIHTTETSEQCDGGKEINVQRLFCKCQRFTLTEDIFVITKLYFASPDRRSDGQSPGEQWHQGVEQL